MRPETTKAVMKLRAGTAGLTDAELRLFFHDVRALPDEALLARLLGARAARAPADPTVAAVTRTMRPIEARAGEKAELLTMAAARKGTPALKARGIPDAVKKLRVYLSDQQILETASTVVRELAARHQPEHRIA